MKSGKIYKLKEETFKAKKYYVYRSFHGVFIA